ncbi:MAG: CvpA family protein [Bryobacteraceae bacterium]|nr:CvpA family protein [Bryobacteraceae bacterium]
MNWNWVDWMILIILAVGVINGLRDGLVRMVFGFGALIVGFLAASWLNGLVAGYLSDWISNRMLAVFLAYALIFSAVMIMGAIIAGVIVRMFKLVGLTPVDRIMGAAFGGVRAMVGLIIVTMVVMAFFPTQLPAAVRRSEFAPYVIGASRVLSGMTPFEIRSGVEKAYNTLRDQIENLRSMKRVPAREE